MKKWKFQINDSPKEISEKLKSSLGRANRFVLNLNSDKKDMVKFKIRSRILISLENSSSSRIIVKGEMYKAAAGNETDVRISFAPHPLLKLLWFGHLVLGLGLLAGMFLKLNSSLYVIVFGGIFLAIGVFFWLHHQREFGKNVQEYKAMISQILES